MNNDNQTMEKSSQSKKRTDIVKDTLVFSLSSLAFSTFLFILFSFLYVRVILNNGDYSPFLNSAIPIYVMLIIPYVIVSVLSVFYTVYSFYLSIIIVFIMGMINVVFAWLFLRHYLPAGFILVSLVISLIYFLFWYIINFRNYDMSLLLTKCVEESIVNIKEHTIKYDLLRRRVFKFKRNSKKKLTSITHIVEYLISSSLTFPICFSIVMIIGKYGFSNIQIVLISLLMLFVGHFFIIYIMLMHELPITIALKKVEQRYGIKFRNI